MIEPGNGPKLRALLSQPQYRGVNICDIVIYPVPQQGPKDNCRLSTGDPILFLPEAITQTFDPSVFQAIYLFDPPNFLKSDALIALCELKRIGSLTPERLEILWFLSRKGMDMNMIRFAKRPEIKKEILERNPNFNFLNTLQSIIFKEMEEEFRVLVEEGKGEEVIAPDLEVKSVGYAPKTAREWGTWRGRNMTDPGKELFVEVLGLTFPSGEEN